MIDGIERKKQNVSKELQKEVENGQQIARDIGLSPRPVKYWVVDNDEMNELAAYGGFQTRYPHWRWGMQYDKQQKQDEYLGGRIFEMVINDDPCHAYLQMSNTLADQKTVIVHVEAHSDFFENNQWFPDVDGAAEMLEDHSETIRDYMEDPDIDRSEVERWIDHALCLEDNIDQYSSFISNTSASNGEEEEEDVDPIEKLGVSEEIRRSVFNDDGEKNPEEIDDLYSDTESDILKFLIGNGKQFDSDTQKAEDMEDWQRDILDIIREEAYYFAPQKMTKVMNEGWTSHQESIMMTDEEFAGDDEIITYADSKSRVLSSGGFNPYRLGKALWEHIENTVNRREVVDKLLRIDGIDADNFHSEIDFQKVFECLDERDSYVPEKRHYSLTRPQNQGFIQDIPNSKLKKNSRYIIDDSKYSNIEEAIDDVDYTKAWERMREIRETHNDVMFIDEFLTQEFVDENQYFTYEFRASHQQNEIASRDVEDVKKKLLLQFTNFGKPTIEVATGNYNNSGELLLLHRYNGISLHIDKMTQLMERMFEMWGRPVNLATVGKIVTEEEMDYAYSESVEPEVQEKPVRFRYDGVEFEEIELDETLVDEVRAEEVDYNTKPSGWKR